MPATSRPFRARRGLIAGAALTASVLTGATAACATVGGASQVAGENQLINDLTERLGQAGTLTYTAIYSLPHGTSATIAQAQNPTRVAYRYPGGALVLTPEETADCRTAATGTATATATGVACTLTRPPSPAADPADTLLSQLAARGLIAPPLVINLLSAVAADAETAVAQHDTTFAGEHATCLDVRHLGNAPSTTFTACITTQGLLGSFTGTVSGDAIDITLDQYEESVAADAFAIPRGATIVDDRTGQ